MGRPVQRDRHLRTHAGLDRLHRQPRALRARWSCSSGNAQAFRNYFSYRSNGFPKQEPTWYYVDYPGVRVVVLDSFAPTAATTQASFLDRALSDEEAALLDRAHARAGVLVGPGRASLAVHEHASGRIIERRNVDLVLSGHDHSYARGHRGRNGTVFVTSVSGSSTTRPAALGWEGRARTAASGRKAPRPTR